MYKNRFRLSKEVNLGSIVECAEKGTTGADMYGLCSTAYMNAVQRLIEENKREEEIVEVIQEDFIKAVKDLKPSLTETQLLEYEMLKEKISSI